MNIEEITKGNQMCFDGIHPSFFLLGLMSAFDNRYQATADNFFEEISWKQFFAIICIDLCKEAPTIRELAEIMGSSHQNVKQILNKLEKKDFIRICQDENDKRKQRIVLTEKTRAFCREHEKGSQAVVAKIFENTDPEDVAVTIKTIMQMEKNLEKIGAKE